VCPLPPPRYPPMPAAARQVSLWPQKPWGCLKMELSSQKMGSIWNWKTKIRGTAEILRLAKPRTYVCVCKRNEAALRPLRWFFQGKSQTLRRLMVTADLDMFHHIFNGNFRILKWRYCPIWGHIFWGYSLKFRPEKKALYMVGLQSIGSWNSHWTNMGLIPLISQ
jgi:hypothetical protein